MDGGTLKIEGTVDLPGQTVDPAKTEWVPKETAPVQEAEPAPQPAAAPESQTIKLDRPHSVEVKIVPAP